MPPLSTRLEHSITPAALRSYLAEFLSTFFFVFAATGSAMSARKITPEATMVDPSCLIATAIATTFSLTVAVYVAVNVSGGHVNPAVTFGMASVPVHGIPQEMTGFGAAIIEGGMT
nr:probable aquaporin TIP5-1 [Tanacetum cinerariifolium]